jgi:hypothetical protein
MPNSKHILNVFFNEKCLNFLLVISLICGYALVQAARPSFFTTELRPLPASSDPEHEEHQRTRGLPIRPEDNPWWKRIKR